MLMHLTAIFNDDELAEQATTKDFLAVRQAESALEQMSLGRVPAMKSFLGCRTGLSALSPPIRGRLGTYFRQDIKHHRESKGNEGVLKGCFERAAFFIFTGLCVAWCCVFPLFGARMRSMWHVA
tara:strand:- start:279 stop:650 length:372 start_codon:yes stop_codon:yes gene_type:complete